MVHTPHYEKCIKCGVLWDHKKIEDKKCPECREPNKLMVNNVNGYNKHAKNPNPKPKDPYSVMTKEEREQLKIKLFRASKRFSRLSRQAMARFDFLDSLDEVPSNKIDTMTDNKLIEIAGL